MSAKYRARLHGRPGYALLEVDAAVGAYVVLSEHDEDGNLLTERPRCQIHVDGNNGRSYYTHRCVETSTELNLVWDKTYIKELTPAR